MPDRQKEIISTYLPGQVTETSRSDSQIQRRVADIRAEVYGENGQIIDLEQSDIYPPKSTVGSAPQDLGQQIASSPESTNVALELRTADIRFQLLAASRTLVDRTKVKELSRALKKAA